MREHLQPMRVATGAAPPARTLAEIVAEMRQWDPYGRSSIVSINRWADELSLLASPASTSAWPHACNQCGGFGGHESGCIGHQAAPPSPDLVSIVAEALAVCACGCPATDHESYGEDGESCGRNGHECIRTSQAVLTLLQQYRAAPPRSEGQER